MGQIVFLLVELNIGFLLSPNSKHDYRSCDLVWYCLSFDHRPLHINTNFWLWVSVFPKPQFFQTEQWATMIYASGSILGEIYTVFGISARSVLSSLVPSFRHVHLFSLSFVRLFAHSFLRSFLSSSSFSCFLLFYFPSSCSIASSRFCSSQPVPSAAGILQRTREGSRTSKKPWQSWKTTPT